MYSCACSNIGLTEIPDEISELQYVTVLHNDIVKSAFLQLYLYNNELTSLNPTLFKLKNLTVLSLRMFSCRNSNKMWLLIRNVGHNHLSSIPPEVALLENLVELSIGNNHLVSTRIFVRIHTHFLLDLYTSRTSSFKKAYYTLSITQPIHTPNRQDHPTNKAYNPNNYQPQRDIHPSHPIHTPSTAHILFQNYTRSVT